MGERGEGRIGRRRNEFYTSKLLNSFENSLFAITPAFDEVGSEGRKGGGRRRDNELERYFN